MQKQLNMLINEEKLNSLQFIAEKERLANTTLAKKIFLESLDKLLLEKSIELYAKGEIGLKKAWKLSGLTFFDFVRKLEIKKVEPPLTEQVQDYGAKVAKTIKKAEIFV